MVGEVFTSCLLCRISLSYKGLDEDDSDEEDWRNVQDRDTGTHTSCLAIATAAAAAADRQEELIVKLRHKGLCYDLFPLFTTITNPAADPNQVSKNIARAIVQQTNKDYWHSIFPEEICSSIAFELEKPLEFGSHIPTLWSIYTKIQEQSNLATILQNVNVLLKWQNNEFWGSRINAIPKESSPILCDGLRPQRANALLVQDIATAVVNGPLTQITFYFNVTSKQRYLSGINVNGKTIGYKGAISENTYEAKGSQGLLLTFNQWGFQSGRTSNRALLPDQKDTAYAVVYWPENSTETIISAIFDSCKCIGLALQGGRIWTSRSVFNTIQSPKVLLDCSTSLQYLINWCLPKFNCILSEIQLSVSTSNLAILGINFKGADGSIRTIGQHLSSNVQLPFPLCHALGELLLYIQVCSSSEPGLISMQFVTSFNRVFSIGDIPENASWSSMKWPSPIYATYQFNKAGFCLFGTDELSINSLHSDFSTPLILSHTSYVTTRRFDSKVAMAKASLRQIQSLELFQYQRSRVRRGYICGVKLIYASGLSIVLGEYGEHPEIQKIQIPAKITELKVWIFEDDEIFQVIGLGFHFEAKIAVQVVGTVTGSETKTLKDIEGLEWATGSMFSDVTSF